MVKLRTAIRRSKSRAWEKLLLNFKRDTYKIVLDKSPARDISSGEDFGFGVPKQDKD